MIKDWPTNHPAFQGEWWLRGFDNTRPCPYKNCYRGFGGVYQIKMFIGGQQRILGESFTRLHAIRFADMAIVYFWKYRQRRQRPITDDDVNFSLETANQDLVEMHDAKRILSELEEALLKQGLIAAVQPHRLKDSRDGQQVRRSLRLHFRQYRADFARAKLLASLVDGSKATVDTLEEYIRHLEKLHESLDKILTPAPEPNQTNENKN